MTARYPLLLEIPAAPGAARCFEQFAPRPHSFFLDSGMDAARLGRWSFMGSDPFLVLRSRGDAITLAKDGVEEVRRGDIFGVINELLETYRLDVHEAGIPFTGGAVGYLSYDLGRLIERLPATAADDLNLPECYLAFYDAVVAYDHQENRAYVCATGLPETGETKRQRRARERLAELKEMIANCPPPAGVTDAPAGSGALTGNFTHQDYLKAVARARDYIGAGDVFEVNLSQRFQAVLNVPPYELYRRLRAINPAPFANYFNFDGVSIVGASPERFLRVRGDRVETRPIKGTRRRGQTPKEDKKLADELLASAKDRAENIMIVDLERNDLGRVCRYGTVEVTELAVLETFPTVFHLTSTVEGQLSPGKTRADLLRASFPGGSITGAPKVRAMEIIEELEPTRRSVYTGSLGYLGFDGNMDLDIVIRTIIVRDGRAYFQVGGAVVYDSEPEAEYQETLDKGRALMAALGLSVEAAA